jgi:polyphosphate glucokinase
VQGFGVDIGGSGIKGCLVDLDEGLLAGERLRIETPQPSLPDPVCEVVSQIVDSFGWTGRIGVTFPGVMKHGVAHTAANMDKSWIGTDLAASVARLIPGEVETLNDADAAGIAEMRYGAGRDQGGVVLMLTFGTGIGSALFYGGKLVPNTELGHLEMRGMDAEKWASAHVKTALNLDWPAWIERVNDYLARMHALFWPDLFILGGAVSERFDDFAPLLRSPARICAAGFAGQAGVIGAALAAAEAAEGGRG